jgi:hypothetical protein
MSTSPKISATAPRVPNEGLRGLELRTPLTELQDILRKFDIENADPMGGWYELVTEYEARYELGPVEIGVDVRDGKVFKLIAKRSYQGKLFGKISIGMNAGEAMTLEPRLYYDEIEDGLLVRGCEGIMVDVPEIDPPPHMVPSHRISAISVYAEEAVAPEGQKGRW